MALKFYQISLDHTAGHKTSVQSAELWLMVATVTSLIDLLA